MEFGENKCVWRHPSDFTGEGKAGGTPHLVFKSDSPAGVTPLLCCCVWKLYTVVPEISRIKYSVCVPTCVCVRAHSLCAQKQTAPEEVAVFWVYNR